MQKEIVSVSVSFHNGGADRILSDLSYEWNKKNCKVYLWQLQKYEDDSVYETAEGLNRLTSSQAGEKSKSKFNFKNLLCCVTNLISFLRGHPNATVVAIINPAILVIALVKPFVSNRVVFSERNDPRNCPSTWLRRKVRDIVYYMADSVIFQTEDARAYFPKKIREKGVIIPNPINPNIPARYLGEKKKVIIAACRLEAQKNLPMMIKAFAKLNHEHPEYVLKIYGQGSEEEQLRKMVQEMRLDGKALLLGFTDDIYDIMNQCYMYVSSSNYEGISNSMLEAMALGLPVVVTNCPIGGARMVVQDGVNGLLVPVGDIDAMYRAMKRIIEEPDFARSLADEAYKVRARFRIDKIVQQWMDVIEEKTL